MRGFYHDLSCISVSLSADQRDNYRTQEQEWEVLF